MARVVASTPPAAASTPSSGLLGSGVLAANIASFLGRGGRRLQGRTLGPAVLLLHGISLSSTCWVVNAPTESLGFILADAGYDLRVGLKL